MSRYVNLDDIILKLKKDLETGDERVPISWACSWLEIQPVADVAEVKHGYWKESKAVVGVNPETLDFEIGNCDRCSVCDMDFRTVRPRYKFCPSCGAKMDAEAAGGKPCDQK